MSTCCFSPPDPLLGLRPWTPLGNFCAPDPPTYITQLKIPGDTMPSTVLTV